jgi:hypothetical protein
MKRLQSGVVKTDNESESSEASAVITSPQEDDEAVASDDDNEENTKGSGWQQWFKTFIKTPNDEDSRPLRACIKWALEHSTQRQQPFPMLVFVRQVSNNHPRYPKPIRRFRAIEINRFIDEHIDICDAARHFDEVIVGDAPCKCYCDFEVEFSDEWARKHNCGSLAALLEQRGAATIAEVREALDASARQLIAQIVQHHHNHQQTTVRPFITVSHKVSKWSMHVVFVNSLWAHAGHIGAYVKRVVRESKDLLVPLYVDMQVYGKNRSMRMYRATKPDEPGRSLLQEGESRDAPVQRGALLDSLITAIPIGDDGKYVTSTYLLSRGEGALAELGLPAPLTDSDFRQASSGVAAAVNYHQSPPSLSVDPSIGELVRNWLGERARMATEIDVFGKFIVRLNQNYCAIAGYEHDNPRSYIVVNLLRQMWRHDCFSPTCKAAWKKKGDAVWSWLPAAMQVVCDQFRDESMLGERFASLRVDE